MRMSGIPAFITARVSLLLLIALSATACRAPMVQPVLPRRAEAPPDVDRLLAPLQRPDGPGLPEAVATAREAVDPAAPGARWLPAAWDAPRFVWFGGLAKNLAPVRALCDGLADEALPSDAKVPCAALTQAIARSEAEAGTLARLPQPLDPATRDALKSKIIVLGPSKAVDPKTKALRDGLIDELLGTGHGRVTGPADVERWRKQLSVRDAALAVVELAAWRVLLAYGHAARARHAGDAWRRVTEQHAYTDAIARRRAKRRDIPWEPRAYPADWPKSAKTATDTVMQTIARGIGSRPADEVIASIRPRGGQYGRLVAARARYRAVIEAGGFVKVPSMGKARRKRAHRHVPALRARLAQEGFVAAPSNPKAPTVFDNPLAQAVLDYQRAHMVRRPRMRVGPTTQRLLAISASEKLARIDAALEAWRRTIPRGEFFVQVNIPDYHVEVWKGDKRLDRIRVVVGNAKRERKEGELVRPNATPTMYGEISNIVYNPYWNIPERILKEDVVAKELREEDLEVQLAWLEGEGYEVVNRNERWLHVRQLPGPDNPLGRVKILFPNAHDVYLHDTPAKSLFRRPVRAYSHGCMRVHQPLRLAQTILEEDGQFDAGAVRRWLKQDEPTTVSLNAPVPIYVEYIPVRIDDDERVWFLRDIYKQFAVRTARR